MQQTKKADNILMAKNISAGLGLKIEQYLYVCSNINIYESILTIILLMLPSIPPECADLITSRDRPPIVEETLVTVNKSTTVKSCTSKQNTCKLPLLRENLQICGEVGSML